jgi:hypothetical protein
LPPPWGRKPWQNLSPRTRRRVCFLAKLNPQRATSLCSSNTARTMPPHSVRLAPIRARIQAPDLWVTELFFRVNSHPLQSWHSIDVNRQAIAIDLVLDRQFHRRIEVAFLLVPADMHAIAVCSSLRQSMNQPRVPMEIEDHRFICREKGIEVPVR